VPEVAVVVHDMVRSVGEKLHHRLVGARVVAQPNVVLADLLKPVEQLQKRRKSVAHDDNHRVLAIHRLLQEITENQGYLVARFHILM